MNESSERLIDERDVGFMQEMVDVLGCANDDPIERKLEQVGALLDARAYAPARPRRRPGFQLVDDDPCPRTLVPMVNNT